MKKIIKKKENRKIGLLEDIKKMQEFYALLNFKFIKT